MKLIAYVIVLVIGGLYVRNMIKEHQSFNSKYFEGCIQFNSMHISVLLLVSGILLGLLMIHKNPVISIVSLFFMFSSQTYNKRVIVEDDGIILRNKGKETYVRWEDINHIRLSSSKYARIRIETENDKIKMKLYSMFKLDVLTRYINKYALEYDIQFKKSRFI